MAYNNDYLLIYMMYMMYRNDRSSVAGEKIEAILPIMLVEVGHYWCTIDMSPRNSFPLMYKVRYFMPLNGIQQWLIVDLHDVQ